MARAAYLTRRLSVDRGLERCPDDARTSSLAGSVEPVGSMGAAYLRPSKQRGFLHFSGAAGRHGRYAFFVPISRRQLDEGEAVLVDLRPHWIFLFGPLATTVVALAAAVAVVTAFPHAPVALAWVLVALVALPALWLVVRATQWWGTSLVVTDRRIVSRQGVFAREVVQVRLPRVAEVHARQELWQRLLGTGRLVVALREDAGAIVVDDVRRPRSLQRVITRQLDMMRSGGPVESGRATARPVQPDDRTPPRGVAGLSGPAGDPAWISEQLIQLDELRRRGIVTENEFAAKKAELLSRL